eukprot:TRINITY_DN2781_c0_g1_i1.p1 TRINITY_DN2781_c0_g1~~TRINITY_DN2781_c0_g1_i1.p1  ORF type:complete len:570 (-),score=137.19 TRINITY_DN2781_c0_g1_i1:24-1733(-)
MRFYCLLFSYILSCIIITGAITFIYLNLYGCCYQGGVSSSNEYAAEVGAFVLKEGGNAIDAFVAMQAVLTVTEPYASGIGGGAFVMYYPEGGDVRAFDGREECPENVNVNVSLKTGGASSGTPGTVNLIVKLSKELGTWSLKRCFGPAIKLAREGWVLDHYGASRLASFAETLKLYNSTRAIYFNQDGEPKKEGDIIYNPDLADTFETIAEDDGESFYKGAIADKIIETVTNSTNPGVMNHDDLVNYLTVEREPLLFSYNGYDIYTMNMPSSAATIPLALNILKGVNFSSTTLTVDAMRDIYNAMSISFADRAQYMADADWIDVPVEGLISPEYGAVRSELMTKTAVKNAAPGTPPGAKNTGEYSFDDESYLTTHFSVADQFGNIVSSTSTIENTWGSQIVVQGQGFLMNNEMSDFSESGVNRPEGGKRARRTAIGGDNTTMGGKRPRSSMSPVIVFKDGKPAFAFGSPGGWRIVTHVLNTIIYLLQFEVSIEEAIELPRFSTRNTGIWGLEMDKFNQTFIDSLKDLGFDNLENLTGYGGGSVNIIAISKDGQISAAADYRREGKALAF